MQYNKNQYESLMQKLFQRQLNYEKSQEELHKVLEEYSEAISNNQAYKDKLYELTEKVTAFQKQEIEKNNALQEEITKLKKDYQQALEKIESLDKKKPQKKTILIVDTSNLVRTKTKKLFEQYEVVYAKDKDEAINILKTRNINLVITDLDIINQVLPENIHLLMQS